MVNSSGNRFSCRKSSSLARLSERPSMPDLKGNRFNYISSPLIEPLPEQPGMPDLKGNRLNYTTSPPIKRLPEQPSICDLKGNRFNSTISSSIERLSERPSMPNLEGSNFNDTTSWTSGRHEDLVDDLRNYVKTPLTKESLQKLETSGLENLPRVGDHDPFRHDVMKHGVNDLINQGRQAKVEDARIAYEGQKSMLQKKRESAAETRRAEDEAAREFRESRLKIDGAKMELLQGMEANLRTVMRGELVQEIRHKVYDREEEIMASYEREIKAKIYERLQTDLEPVVRAQLSATLEAEIKQELKSELELEVRRELWIKNESSVREDLRVTLDHEVRNQLRETLKNEVREELKREFIPDVLRPMDDGFRSRASSPKDSGELSTADPISSDGKQHAQLREEKSDHEDEDEDEDDVFETAQEHPGLDMVFIKQETFDEDYQVDVSDNEPLLANQEALVEAVDEGIADHDSVHINKDGEAGLLDDKYGTDVLVEREAEIDGFNESSYGHLRESEKMHEDETSGFASDPYGTDVHVEREAEYGRLDDDSQSHLHESESTHVDGTSDLFNDPYGTGEFVEHGADDDNELEEHGQNFEGINNHPQLVNASGVPDIVSRGTKRSSSSEFDEEENDSPCPKRARKDNFSIAGHHGSTHDQPQHTSTDDSQGFSEIDEEMTEGEFSSEEEESEEEEEDDDEEEYEQFGQGGYAPQGIIVQTNTKETAFAVDDSDEELFLPE